VNGLGGSGHTLALPSAKIVMKKSPRIYTYKVTFEEIPYWYWGVHKEKKFGELYLGTPKTHKWMWKFYTPKIQILEFFPNTDEGWKEANLVEKRLIKPDINNSLCLNENCGGHVSLTCARKGVEKLNKKLHEAKDENGKSLHSLGISKNLHEAKDENGKSLHNLKTIHKERDEHGKSLHSQKNIKKTNAQVWESTIDGFQGNAGNVAKHNRANGWDPNARARVG
jgi:hypothetical protein